MRESRRSASSTLHEVLVRGYRQSMLILPARPSSSYWPRRSRTCAGARACERPAIELLLRMAIGASRFHLARQLAVEARAAGGSRGSLSGHRGDAGGYDLAKLWAPASIPRLGEVTVLDGTVALFVLAVAGTVTGLLTFAPLAAFARVSAADTLRLASRGAIGDRWNHRVRNAMVVGRNCRGARPAACDGRARPEPAGAYADWIWFPAGWDLSSARIAAADLPLPGRHFAFLRSTVRTDRGLSWRAAHGGDLAAPLSGVLGHSARSRSRVDRRMSATA